VNDAVLHASSDTWPRGTRIKYEEISPSVTFD
jgi:hypothetical protein